MEVSAIVKNTRGAHEVMLRTDANVRPLAVASKSTGRRARDAHAMRRRSCLIVLPLWPMLVRAATPLEEAMQRARAMRDQAVSAGDQPYGAVVLQGDRIVGEAPSRVVSAKDPNAHAEREAIRDARRRLGTPDLAGCVLVSTSRPCRLCESAAAEAQISRMIHGDRLVDAGRPA